MIFERYQVCKKYCGSAFFVGAPRKGAELMNENVSKEFKQQVKLKEFFYLVYGDQIGKLARFTEGQKVRLTDFDRNTVFYDDVDVLIRESLTRFKGRNAYFTLATTNGGSGRSEDLIKRTVIALDFDKKDQGIGFNYAEVMARFKRLGLYYHAIVDSGNGYHVYIAIEPTTDHKLVNDVTKALALELGADNKATLETQVLRIPFTLNTKDPKNKKPVNLIHMYSLETIKRYGLAKLSERFLTARNEYKSGLNTIAVMENTNIPICIQRIIQDGSIEGNRNADLQKIVVVLRQRNKVVTEIMRVAEEWAQRCKPVFTDRLDYQVNQIYDFLKYANLGCEVCKTKSECRMVIESEFSFDGDLITIAESQARHLKASNREGAKVMNGNELLVLGILKNHADGLTRLELTKELTYTDRKANTTTVALCEKTLKETLKKLKADSFIGSTTDKAPIYKVNEPRTPIELTYKISYGATYEAVKGRISTEELRLYNYMRYIHHKDQRINTKALKGNLLQVTQSELAKDLGVTQVRISQMIDSLLCEKIISIWHRQKSKNNGFEFNIYRLNY